jgi:hypothetical protein
MKLYRAKLLLLISKVLRVPVKIREEYYGVAKECS